MNITTRKDGETLIIELEGRLDTVTSQELAANVPHEMRNNLNIIFDFAKLEYISSAGLRILIAFKKDAQATNNTMIIKNCNAVIKEIFHVTGFDKILKIE